jgi:multisubunit Na+/H+ antiporter MnhG subunit
VSVRDVIADVLLALAAGTVLASSVGILVMRDVYQKLHFVTPAAIVAPLGPAVESAAVRFQDQAGYTREVLSGTPVTHPVALLATGSAGISTADVLTGLGSATGALVLAYLALYWRRLPLLRRGFEPGTGLVRPIQRFQSGVVNDYVTWIVVGLACLGGALAFAIR